MPKMLKESKTRKEEIEEQVYQHYEPIKSRKWNILQDKWLDLFNKFKCLGDIKERVVVRSGLIKRNLKELTIK